jgi:hypothetical protein
MAAISPRDRRFRGFYMVFVPILHLAVILGAVCVLVFTQQATLVIPLTVFGILLSRPLRWTMFWVSTVEEQAVFARGLDYEPIWAVIRDLIRAWRPPGPAE